MAHWEPQLVVFAYGVNEAREGRPLDAFEKETREGIVGIRKAAAGASCLLIGPNDIGFEDPTSNDPSNPYVEKVVEVERRLAGELGCAFWDQRKAMGGTGSMGKWKRAGLAQADLLHPSKTGAQVLATWLYQALMESYQGYRARGRK
jgi:lysophospholipase L1-like esterase